ncbi:MAG: carboxypeptidase regulatory-like domain-containing protein [Myxococcales bacterium]|nr:carboxypeptidase regulatory-like domain-containing protein [Myxococcales bacterium]
MSGARYRWAGLAVAVALVAAALWVLQRPPRSRGEGAEGEAEQGSAAGLGRGAGRGRGVTPRETSVPGHGWVRAQVVDEDGAAVTEGRITLWCLSTDGAVDRVQGGALTLDEDGRFEGPGCRGVVCPELHHPYRVPAEPWSLRSGPEQVLEARSLPRLWGRVVDPEGAPVAGARIVASKPPEDADDPTAALPVVSPQTSSDAEGEFSLARIERPPCDPCQQARGACSQEALPVLDRVLLTARAPGWAPGSAVVALDEATEADAPAQVVLQPAQAAITGRLVDAEGQPLPGASVLARSEVQPAEQHQAAAADGVFALDSLGEGPYTVRAIKDGRELVRRSGVEPGATLELRLADAARDVELEVVDEQGRPWPGVRVDGGPFAGQRSDAQGLVRAQRVLPGAYILRVRPPGGRARAHDLEVPGGPVGSAEPRNPSPLRIEVASGT